MIGRHTIKNKKWRFSVVAQVYRGIEPLVAPAWDWILDPIKKYFLLGIVNDIPKVTLNLQ